MNQNSNNGKGLFGSLLKVGGFILGGAFAVVSGIIEGISDAFGSATDL